MDIVLQKPLPGATVSIPSLNYSTATDDEGVFRFKDMPLGSYRITVTYSGFKEVTLENIADQFRERNGVDRFIGSISKNGRRSFNKSKQQKKQTTQ